MKSESPWNKLAEFIERVKKGFENQQEPEGPSIPVVEKLASGGMLFSQEELGGLLLTPEDATEFRMCVDSIQELVAGRDGKISTNAVEKILQTAVLKALDINNTDPEPDFSKRIARGIQEAQTSLKRKCDTYLVRLEVQGLDPKGLPVQFGGIKFYVADQNSIPELNEETAKAKDSDDEMQKKRVESNRLFRSNIVASIKGRTYAEIEVEAFDLKAAGLMAESQLRLTLDALNYFGDFFSHEGAKVFLPGDATTSKHIAVIGKKGETESHRFEFSHKGPPFPFSFPTDRSPVKNVEAFEKVSALLSKRDRNSLEKRLLAAIQWAGRASADDRTDKAFLHSCISLEALLAKKDDRGEVALSFALRGAHLLLQDAAMRGKIFADLKALYGLRSKIVHEGKTNIPDSDLAKIQMLAKQAMFIVLVEEPFSSMTDGDDLERWFLEQQLGGIRIVTNNPDTEAEAKDPARGPTTNLS